MSFNLLWDIFKGADFPGINKSFCIPLWHQDCLSDPIVQNGLQCWNVPRCFFPKVDSPSWDWHRDTECSGVLLTNTCGGDMGSALQQGARVTDQQQKVFTHSTLPERSEGTEMNFLPSGQQKWSSSNPFPALSNISGLLPLLLTARMQSCGWVLGFHRDLVYSSLENSTDCKGEPYRSS